MIKILSYNINGIRAAIKKDLVKWIEKSNPDIVCFQEIKANDKESYDYLVKSIKTHESQEQILTMMKECSFINTGYKNLFKGVVAIHKGKK